jgi:hypothetical protein
MTMLIPTVKKMPIVGIRNVMKNNLGSVKFCSSIGMGRGIRAPRVHSAVLRRLILNSGAGRKRIGWQNGRVQNQTQKAPRKQEATKG